MTVSPIDPIRIQLLAQFPQVFGNYTRAVEYINRGLRRAKARLERKDRQNTFRETVELKKRGSKLLAAQEYHLALGEVQVRNMREGKPWGHPERYVLLMRANAKPVPVHEGNGSRAPSSAPKKTHLRRKKNAIHHATLD